MCYSPVRVRNNKHGWNAHFDRVYNYVPCNHCGECLTNKRNQYLIRTLAESDYMYRKVGDIGFYVKTALTFFVTLSYSDSNLPTMMFPDGVVRSTFSVDDLQKFFKRLQFQLDKLGVHFHKICVCEYGHGDLYKDRHGLTRRGTYRPHYHILLFLDSDFNHFLLQQIIIRCWKQGIVLFGRNGDGSVTSQGALRYVTKYVTKFDSSLQFFKDFLNDYNEDELTKEFISRLKNKIYYADILEKLQFLNAIKSRVPFVITSMNFGMGLYVSDQIKLDPDNDKVFYNDDKKGSVVELKLPLYYLRKKNYEYDINVTDKYKFKIHILKNKSFRVGVNYKVDVRSFPTDDHLQRQLSNISDRFNSLVSSVRNMCCSFASHYRSGLIPETVISDKCLCKFVEFVSPEHLSYYIMFNRGYDNYVCLSDLGNYDLDNSFMYRLNTVNYFYADYLQNRYLFFERILQLLYDYNRYCGFKRDEVFRIEYERDKLKRSYNNNFY